MMGAYPMNAAKLLEAITLELKLARTLLELADPDLGDPTDAEGAARVIQHGRTALEAARTFMPSAKLAATELAYLESELTYLEEAFEVRCKREGKSKGRARSV
jgi:hypothetical protein